MTQVLAATIAFVGGHFLLSHPLRAPLTRRMGEAAFLALYSALFLVILAWLVWAALAAGDGPVWWVAGPAVRTTASAVMLFAAVLLAGSVAGNPALPDPTGRTRPPARPTGVFAITRHPMMWSFGLWAAVHVAVWGSLRNVVIAGGMGLLALAGAAAQDAKKRRLVGESWATWQRVTAFVPFSAQLSGRLPWRAAWPGWRALAGGAVLWLAATWAHRPIGGLLVPPWG